MERELRPGLGFDSGKDRSLRLRHLGILRYRTLALM
jgi:hypothetical protein